MLDQRMGPDLRREVEWCNRHEEESDGCPRIDGLQGNGNLLEEVLGSLHVFNRAHVTLMFLRQFLGARKSEGFDWTDPLSSPILLDTVFNDECAVILLEERNLLDHAQLTLSHHAISRSLNISNFLVRNRDANWRRKLHVCGRFDS